MEIKRKYLTKYLHDIAIEQLSDEYRERGYVVFKEQKIGNYNADIFATKGDDKIVIEVKAGKMTPNKKDKIKELANYVRNQGDYKFLIAVATPPKEKKLDISDLNKIIENYLINNMPDELEQLSTHTQIDEVIDIDLDEISIEGDTIIVKGDGVVEVILQLGSDGDLRRDDGVELNDSFPFDFELVLEYGPNKSLEISEVDVLDVDTSSYYD